MNAELLAIFGFPGGPEWIVILVIALLIFGRRLPDLMRSVGKSIVEFKKGLRDVKDEVDVRSEMSSREAPKLDKASSAPASPAPDRAVSGSDEGSG